jgi:tetratricopeptide (TPR) repeat protein
MLLIGLSINAFGQDPFPNRRQTQTGSAALGVHVLYGDLFVDEGGSGGSKKPLLYEVVLYNQGGTIVARQSVAPGGRYRFQNLKDGLYELAAVLNGDEIARIRAEIPFSPYQHDYRQDLALKWTETPTTKPGSISATDYYKRSAANEALFTRSKEATDQKRYDDAIAALQQLVAQDPRDFQAWTELGTVFLFKGSYEDSEAAYQKAISERPTFFLAHMDLGKLRYVLKKFDTAIEPLTEAVRIQPTSADANYYLGESYLQIKKGSKAVGYLYEALKLDPVGRADVHLHLAALYNAAGLKDKAAKEYEDFLKKKPDYPERKKLEQYIAENKSTAKTP